MKLTVFSTNRLMMTFEKWRVIKDHVDPMFNYLVYGFDPGSFFTSVLANDCLSAFQRSHPVNKMQDLKNLAGWIRDHVPVEARGGYPMVKYWLELDSAYRRVTLEANHLIYTEEEEIILTLQAPELPPKLQPVF